MSFKGRIIRDVEASAFPMPELIEKGVETPGGPDHSIEDIEREAYERGFEAGEKAGIAMGEEKAKILLSRIETSLKEILSLRKEVLRGLGQEVLELSVSIARQIILREIHTEPETLLNMTKEALMRIDRRGQIRIKINPSLHSLFLRLRPELQSLHEEIVFDPDPSVSSLGALIIGPEEEVSTDIDEQLRNLIKELGERIGSINPQTFD